MDDPTKDTIPRSAVEYCLRKETVSTNPEKYKTHEKFIDYMNDPDISEFGHWMHSNGFNCALVSIAVDLDKIPSVTPSAQPGCVDAVSRADVDILIEEAQTAWLRGDILLMYPALKKGLKKVPSVTPKQSGWISVTERLPENEQEVFVTVEVRPIGCKPRRRVIKAFYTDGKHTDADSAYTWYELEEPDFDDDGNIIVPEGWWEAVDYSDEFNMIDDFVVAWREPLEPWEEEKAEGAATQ